VPEFGTRGRRALRRAAPQMSRMSPISAKGVRAQAYRCATTKNSMLSMVNLGSNWAFVINKGYGPDGAPCRVRTRSHGPPASHKKTSHLVNYRIGFIRSRGFRCIGSQNRSFRLRTFRLGTRWFQRQEISLGNAEGASVRRDNGAFSAPAAPRHLPPRGVMRAGLSIGHYSRWLCLHGKWLANTTAPLTG